MPTTTEFLLGLPGLRNLGYLDQSFGTVKPVMMAEEKQMAGARGGTESQASAMTVTADDLFNPIGSVDDVPRLQTLPTGIQKLLHKFKSVFSPNLEKNRCMKTEPATIELNEIPLPPPCQKTRQVPHHWRDKARAIIRHLEEQDIIV